MITAGFINTLAASILVISGAGLLYYAWKTTGSRPSYVWSGWACLAAAAGFWIAATGTGIGIVLALVVPAPAAWLLVLLNRELRQRRNHRRQAPAPESILDSTSGSAALPALLVRHGLLFLLAIPGAAVAATLVSITLPRLLPWSQTNQMVLTIFAMPVLWGAAAVWVCGDRNPLRPAAALLVGGSVSALLLAGGLV